MNIHHSLAADIRGGEPRSREVECADTC
jgi:hypothetical protein